MGLECLSRGASSAVFFEYDRRAFAILEGNVSAMGVGEQGFCWRVDVVRTSFRPKGVGEVFPYSMVFFDPPYKLASDLAPGKSLARSLDRVARDSVTLPNATLVLRTPRELPLELAPSWEEFEQLNISSSRISFCRKRIEEPDVKLQKENEVD